MVALGRTVKTGATNGEERAAKAVDEPPRSAIGSLARNFRGSFARFLAVRCSGRNITHLADGTRSEPDACLGLALEVTSHVALGNGAALVVRLLAAGHPDLQLGHAITD